MSHLILHHYPSSPFSEKIRAVLGFKQLAWKSVIIPSVMPKPDVVALTGGYRKTPFLQIGADIYCDSALICDVLEHEQPEPVLYPPHLKGVARVFAQWADSTLFWAAMAYNLQPKGAAVLFANLPPAAAQVFGEDRREMSAGMQRLRPADATAAYRSYLRRIAHMAEEHDFLFGAEPCLADFAAYHPLWFTRQRVPAMADVFQDEHGIPLGSQVTISAESFGTEPTEGELIAATRTRYTLRRTDPRAGTVHVHFPRIGYVLRATP